MKKTIASLILILLLFSSLCWGDNKNAIYSYWGMTSLPNDTIWIPGEDVNDTLGGIWGQPLEVGMDLTHYNYFGYKVHVVQADSVLVDLVTPTIWTGYYGDADSIKKLYNGTAITDTPSVADVNRMFKTIIYTDSNLVYWFQKYVWMGLIVSTANVTDTIDTNQIDATLWSAAGDSLRDWSFKNAGGHPTGYAAYPESVLCDVAESTYIYVTADDDSIVVFSAAGSDVPASPGIIDSVVVLLTTCDSLAVITGDSIRVGICFGDSSKHHLDSLRIGYGGAIAWGAVKASPKSHAHTVKTWAFTTNPRGYEWTRSNFDSLFIAIESSKVDTVAAGTSGMLMVTNARVKVYHRRDTLYPPLKYRVDLIMKE